MPTLVSRACMLLLLGSLTCLAGADWPRFRGPNGAAVSEETGVPTRWSDTENIVWKIELPGPGASSPIVSGDRVYVTCYSGYGVDRSKPGEQQNLTRHLVCANLADGKVVWQKSVPATLPEDRYDGMLTEHGYASSTPATDGEHIVVLFGKSGVVAFDRDGNQLWQKSVGTGSGIMGWGSGASLLVYKNLVIVNANAESESLLGLDIASGREVWKAEAKGYVGSWSTPLLVDVDGKTELAVNMPGEVWGMDPSDGGLLWYCSGVGGSANTSLAAADGRVYAVSGGPGGSSVAAIRAGGRDDVSKTHVVWKKSVGSYVPSPLVLGENLHWVDDRGVAYCLKADTGEQVYRERLSGAGGVYASMLAVDGKLYAVTRRSGAFVLSGGPKLETLAQNQIQSDSSDFNASPAISNGRLLLRSNRFLYCIAAK